MVQTIFVFLIKYPPFLIESSDFLFRHIGLFQLCYIKYRPVALIHVIKFIFYFCCNDNPFSVGEFLGFFIFGYEAPKLDVLDAACHYMAADDGLIVFQASSYKGTAFYLKCLDVKFAFLFINIRIPYGIILIFYLYDRSIQIVRKRIFYVVKFHLIF